MKFRSYDALRVFSVAARTMSFTQAAKELNLTKGAISYQIKRLEDDLGFSVFNRQHGTISLTPDGEKVFHSSQAAFNIFESQISQLINQQKQNITIGMSTYFASRWLAPRLMSFTSAYTNIGLRLQPMINLLDLEHEAIDMAIRWGNGIWSDMKIERLFNCPAIATAGKTIANKIKKNRLDTILKDMTLLHDSDDSQAWNDWFNVANLTYKPNRNDLIIPDPNVRVQAVINGQGLALNDSLVFDEIKQGRLFQVSPVELKDYGYYLAYPEAALTNPALAAFRDWIIEAAHS